MPVLVPLPQKPQTWRQPHHRGAVPAQPDAAWVPTGPKVPVSSTHNRTFGCAQASWTEVVYGGMRDLGGAGPYPHLVLSNRYRILSDEAPSLPGKCPRSPATIQPGFLSSYGRCRCLLFTSHWH
ncbi:unnamed protein product [Merluccius merluccius]